MTRQQKLICQILQSGSGHLTAEAIFFLARKEIPSIAMGTVYRNLNLLAADGRIRRLTVPGQPDRFDHITCQHGHLLCPRCGKLEDLLLPGLMDMLRQTSGQEITAYELTVCCVCAECRQTGEHPPNVQNQNKYITGGCIYGTERQQDRKKPDDRFCR